tara:strand:+ start:16998 stop:18101 length:1104 start_codon:yes stop_codon:yes gene_type:complete
MELKKQSLIGNFFLKCSGASVDIINKCPEYERIKYSSIGATIFFTSILAFISSFYGLSQIFNSYYLVFPLAIFWGLIIFNLDRYIVQSLRSGDSKYQNLIISIPRLFLAILVAVIISKPLEVKLFEDEINTYLTQKNIDRIYTIEEKYKSDILSLNEQKSTYESSFEEKLKLREKYYEDYRCECNGTCGTGLRGRGRECEERKLKYDIFSSEVEIERKKKDALIDRIIQKETQLWNQVNSEKEILQATSNMGFFDKIGALNEVGNMASVLIMFIFILIETAPLLTKLLSKKGPYDNLIMQSEFEFETNFLKVLDFNINQRKKNEELNKITTDLEKKSMESEIKFSMREKTLKKYEEIRRDEDSFSNN